MKRTPARRAIGALVVVSQALALAGAVESASPAPSGRVLVGRPVPRVALTGLDGRDMSTATARGKFLLLAFSDAKSKEAGQAFFRAHAARFLAVDGLALHNVIVPGGVLLAPRSVILMRVRTDAARLTREVRASLPGSQRARFDRADLRWHVDFDRRYTALFDAPLHRIALVLVDPQGRVLAREDEVDAAAVDRLLALAAR